MPFKPEQDARKVATYVGLPAGRDFDLPGQPVPLDRVPGGRGYEAIAWGLRVEWDATRYDWDGARIDDEPPPWPSMTAIVSTTRELVTAEDGTRSFRLIDESRTYQLWLIQVWRPGSPLAAERRWHPELGIQDAIIGLHEPHTRGDVHVAHRGRRLLAGLQDDARQEIARATDLRLAARAARRLAEDGKRVTRSAIFDLVEPDHPDLEYETLLKRWQRHNPPITLRVILEEVVGP